MNKAECVSKECIAPNYIPENKPIEQSKKGITVTVSLKDTDFVKDLVKVIKGMINDPGIPNNVKEKYNNQIQEIINEFERGENK